MKKLLWFTLPLLFTNFADAACPSPDQYELLVPIGTISGCVDLGTYLKGMFETIIGIAGIIAVLMIVWCGIKLMTAESAGGKSEAKKCISNAIFGVLLAVGSWLILNTINPLLLIGKPSAGITAAPLPPSTPTAVNPSGVLSWETGPSCPAKAGMLAGVVPPTACTGTPPPGSVCCRYVAVPAIPTPSGNPIVPLPPIFTPGPTPTPGPVAPSPSPRGGPPAPTPPPPPAPVVPPPIVSFLLPTPKLMSTTTNINATLSVVDPSGLSTFTLYLKDASTSQILGLNTVCTGYLCPIPSGTFNTVLNTGAKPGNYYNLVAQACDPLGNCGWATTSVGLSDVCTPLSSTSSRQCFVIPSNTNAIMTPPIIAGSVISPVVPRIVNAHLFMIATSSTAITGTSTIVITGGGSNNAIIASISPVAGDMSVPYPCGNSGSFPGANTLTILVGAVGGPNVCIIKPGFNYYLNLLTSDGAAHNFVINYNWVP